MLLFVCADTALSHSSRQLSQSTAALIIGVYNTLPTPLSYDINGYDNNSDFSIAYRQIIEADGMGQNYDLSLSTASSSSSSPLSLEPRYLTIPKVCSSSSSTNTTDLSTLLTHNNITCTAIITPKKTKSAVVRAFLLMLHPTTPAILQIFERNTEAYIFLNILSRNTSYIHVCSTSDSDSICAYGFRWRTCTGSYEQCEYIYMHYDMRCYTYICIYL